MVGYYFFTGPSEAIDSIAVLPLENLSGDPEQDYFVEAMHEALITDLSKIAASQEHLQIFTIVLLNFIFIIL